MKEIVNRLHEAKQVKLAKSILKSNGYKVNMKINESALDKFWDLYDSSDAVSDALEKIADDLGIDPDVAPTEEEAQQILDAYEDQGGYSKAITAEGIIDDIMYAIEDLPSVKRVSSFEDEGLMTKNKGFVVTDKNGKEYQFSLLGSF